MCITSITSGLRPLWGIKAQFSTRPNWASKTIAFFSVYFSLTNAITYAAFFILIFLIELYIALYVHDDFVRPYIGDVFVTMLICCFCRIFFPQGIRLLPVYVLIFAMLVETAQYFNIITHLGLQDNALACTIIGTSFSHIDLACYAVGCILFWCIERAVVFFVQRR